MSLENVEFYQITALLLSLTVLTYTEMFLEQKINCFEMSAASGHNQVAFSRNGSFPQKCGISWDPTRCSL